MTGPERQIYEASEVARIRERLRVLPGHAFVV
jgi:hypothetical protein